MHPVLAISAEDNNTKNNMKHIISLVALAFTLSLGACCTKDGGSCPMGGKKDCATAKGCCKTKTCTKEGGCKHKH